MDIAHDASDLHAIATVFDELAAAHAARDAKRIVALYADDALIYDLAPPLARRGMGESRIDEWLATWDGPILIDGTETQTTISGDLAVSTGLVRMRGPKDDVTVDLWLRTTTVLRRTADGWRIVHDHGSVPFYMDGSFRAATDLRPA